MYIVVQGCQWCICLPGISPRSATSACAGADPALLDCGFGSAREENQGFRSGSSPGKPELIASVPGCLIV